MELVEHKFEELSKLKYSIYSCNLPSRPYLNAVIVAFEGEYGYGSAGNGDALFMTAIIKGALAAWEPSALILDLRKMSYKWGDLIIKAIGAGAGSYPSHPFPTAILGSELNQEGLTSLIEREMGEDPSKWLFTSVEAVLQAVEKKIPAQ